MGSQAQWKRKLCGSKLCSVKEQLRVGEWFLFGVPLQDRHSEDSEPGGGWTVQTVPLFQPGTLIVLGTLIVTTNCPGLGTLIVIAGCIDTSLNSQGP